MVVVASPGAAGVLWAVGQGGGNRLCHGGVDACCFIPQGLDVSRDAAGDLVPALTYWHGTHACTRVSATATTRPHATAISARTHTTESTLNRLRCGVSPCSSCRETVRAAGAVMGVYSVDGAVGRTLGGLRVVGGGDTQAEP